MPKFIKATKLSLKSGVRSPRSEVQVPKSGLYDRRHDRRHEGHHEKPHVYSSLPIPASRFPLRPIAILLPFPYTCIIEKL